MQGWEYLMVPFDCRIPKQVEAELNVFGDDGWELVTIHEQDGGESHAVMKRSKCMLFAGMDAA